MPVYEYRCRACGDTFEELRTAPDADAPVGCGYGEADVTRMPSMIAARTTGAELPMARGASGGGGGCCGGGTCGCGH